MIATAISNAINRAYNVMEERNWDIIYWAIDLHGVCLRSSYERGNYEWINGKVLKGLKAIVSKKESKIILWSSAHSEEQQAIIEFFETQGIPIHAFNENPEILNTNTGDFSKKFYFSVLLDDKAGFDPDIHWDEVINYLSLIEELALD